MARRRMWMCAAVMIFLGVTATAEARQVYVTPKGRRYHTATCPLIKGKQTRALNDVEARKEGYSPCGRCLKEEAKAFIEGKPLDKVKEGSESKAVKSTTVRKTVRKGKKH